MADGRWRDGRGPMADGEMTDDGMADGDNASHPASIIRHHRNRFDRAALFLDAVGVGADWSDFGSAALLPSPAPGRVVNRVVARITRGGPHCDRPRPPRPTDRPWRSDHVDRGRGSLGQNSVRVNDSIVPGTHTLGQVYSTCPSGVRPPPGRPGRPGVSESSEWTVPGMITTPPAPGAPLGLAALAPYLRAPRVRRAHDVDPRPAPRPAARSGRPG
jgi:hypothetical protein